MQYLILSFSVSGRPVHRTATKRTIPDAALVQFNLLMMNI